MKNTLLERKSVSDAHMVYTLLADDISKEVFTNMLDFHVSGGEGGGMFRVKRRFIDRYNTIDNNIARIIYIANGISEHRELQYPPINGSFALCEEIMDFAGRFEGAPIVYGAGAQARNALQILEFSGIGNVGGQKNIRCFWDNDKRKQYHLLCRVEILPPFANDSEDSPVFIATSLYFDEVYKFLLETGMDESRIFPKNFADVPSWIMEDAFRYYDWDQYFDKDLIKFENDGYGEVFLDCGSLDFWTAMNFLKRAPKARKIYSFEADPDNIAVIENSIKKSGFANVELIEAAVYDRNEKLHFVKNTVAGVGGGRLDINGANEVNAVRIDDVVSERVTFIKMDIEGAELAALAGAEEIIKRDKPRLAISVYHKPDDIVDIPLYIHGIVPEYRLYMRHHASFHEETVLYAVI
ncbi:MAG: FkbM family methyltransferase [Clostridiales Family XIII bacterium]|nr:FkbM family methyltransferase [Clostridiales Family XIII bacterium]